MDSYLTQITNYLLTQSWQIAVLVAVVAAVTLAMKNRSAHVRYLLWLIVLARCIVPPLFTIPLAVLPETEVSEVLTRSEDLIPLALEGGETPAAEAPVSPASLAVSEPTPTAAETTPRLSVRQWLGLGWVIGATLFVLVAATKAMRTEFWLRRERKPLPAGLQGEIEDLFSSLGVRISPKLWLVEGIGQPFVWGLLRGDIYLPANFAGANNAEHRRGVLGHELSHVLRFDAAVNLLQIMAQAAFWFHPFVWWANKRIRAEREKCCDEMTIARLGAKAKDYSKAIVNILISEHESTRPVPMLAVAGPVKNVEERIKTMLRPGKKFYKRPSLITASIIFLAAVLTVPSAVVLTARAQTEPPKAKTNAPQTLHQAAAAGDKEQVQKLLAQGDDINAQDGGRGGRTALHYAAQAGHREMVELLLANGADVNAGGFGSENKTAADFAMHNDHSEIVELLFSKGADISPLHVALARKDRAKAKDLIENGADVKRRSPWGMTALHLAASRGFADVAELLIAKGADVNARCNWTWTPLHTAAGKGDKDMVELLVAKGADVNIKTPQGETPLDVAVAKGDRAVVEILAAKDHQVTALQVAAVMGDIAKVKTLLEQGTNVNTRYGFRKTALHYAARAAYKEIVEVLVANGADVNAGDGYGMTAAQCALGKGHTEIVELLISKGAADISPLLLAVHKRDLAKATDLIGKGADVNRRTQYGTAPLHLAAEGGLKDIAALLIDKGANVNVTDNWNWTPLHNAAENGQKDIVELLIAKAAEVNARDRGGWTPLSRAREKAHSSIVDLLQKHGAKE
jgi:cytohesin